MIHQAKQRVQTEISITWKNAHPWFIQASHWPRQRALGRLAYHNFEPCSTSDKALRWPTKHVHIPGRLLLCNMNAFSLAKHHRKIKWWSSLNCAELENPSLCYSKQLFSVFPSDKPSNLWIYYSTWTSRTVSPVPESTHLPRTQHLVSFLTQGCFQSGRPVTWLSSCCNAV